MLLDSLGKLFRQCWSQEAVPQDFKDANIIYLYKHKRDRSYCNNHRGISLLSVAGKVFARILLHRLVINIAE